MRCCGEQFKLESLVKPPQLEKKGQNSANLADLNSNFAVLEVSFAKIVKQIFLYYRTLGRLKKKKQ